MNEALEQTEDPPKHQTSVSLEEEKSDGELSASAGAQDEPKKRKKKVGYLSNFGQLNVLFAAV